MLDPRAELGDPSTSAQRLFEIAQTNPELGSFIASHPNAYPELIDWVSQSQAATPAATEQPVDEPLEAVVADHQAAAPATPEAAAPAVDAPQAAPLPQHEAPMPGAAQPDVAPQQYQQPYQQQADPQQYQQSAPQQPYQPAAAQPTTPQPYAEQPTAVQPTAAQPTAPQPFTEQPTQQFAQPTTQLPQGGYPAQYQAAPGGPGVPVAPGGYAQAGGQPPRKSRKALWITIIAVVVVAALVAAFFFIVKPLLDKTSGSKTPEAAASKMIEGLTTLDPLTLYGAMAPSEVSAFKEPYEVWLDMELDEDDDDTMRELMSDLSDAFDIRIDNLDIETENIIEGVERSIYRAGEITIDGDEDKIVDVIMEIYEMNADVSGVTGMGPGFGMPFDADMLEREIRDSLDLPYTIDFADLGRDSGQYVSVVTVEENGLWYVSPMLSVADIVYQSMDGMGQAGPLGTSLIEGKPSDSAAEAASALTDAILNGSSLEEIAERLPLTERRLISIYGDAFELPRGWNDDINLESNDFTADEDGSKARVSIEELRIVNYFTSFGAPRELENSIKLWEHCAEISSEYYSSWTDEVVPSTMQGCLDEIGIVYEEFGLDHFALIAVKEDGGWYLSPINTIADMSAIVISHVSELSRDGRLEEVLESLNGF